MAITPTFSVESYCVQAMHAKESLTPADEAFPGRWETMLQTNLGHCGRLHEAGVTIVAGTDAGWRFTAFDPQAGRRAEALATAAAR